ncbi:MAG: hypothetical protein PUB19_00315 [Lachnospiraceae bacterium]|nr:hypothetical protein [Lachnospiraceae bacterium]
MSKKNYENFPLSLALFDALPVIFFCIAMIVIATGFHNGFFIAGAMICTWAGLGKVVWKIIIASTGKDINLLNKQLRVLMPVGFFLMIVGAVTGMDGAMWRSLVGNIISFPANVFFGITMAGMILMSIFAVKLDSTKARSHWIEQITNAIAQGYFLLGVLCCIS